MLKILIHIMTNQIFVAASVSWILAQMIKMIVYYRQYHRLNFRLLVGTGGMPSAHSAFVSGMACMVGFKDGWSSSIFVLALCLALLIMSDAAGVRRAVGRQAVVLNHLADEVYAGKGLQTERLRELLGHTPLQVFAGAFLGILMACGLMALAK